MEVWEESKIVFDGKVVRLRTGSIRLDNGAPAYREVIEHPGGACVLPWTGSAFVFVRQYRIALQQYLLEAPAGKLEQGESPEECARKELHEETGYTADTLIPLGKVFPSVGFCNEAIHLFLAMGLTEVGTQLEPEERIEIVSMTMNEVHQQLEAHDFQDGKTEILVRRTLAYLGIHGSA